MATQNNISDYFSGEPFIVEATLTDENDSPITNGTITLKVARSSCATSKYEGTGDHLGSGVWSFDLGPLSSLGNKAYYDIRDEDSYILAYGSIHIRGTIL